MQYRKKKLSQTKQEIGYWSTIDRVLVWVSQIGVNQNEVSRPPLGPTKKFHLGHLRHHRERLNSQSEIGRKQMAKRDVRVGAHGGAALSDDDHHCDGGQ